MRLKKQIKKLLELTGLFPYPYYILKHNKPYDVIQRLITKSNPVIFDIGANTGTSISALKTLSHSNTIYSFEPDPRTYHKLKTNWGHIKNVNLFNLALSDDIGSIDFFVTKSNLASSMLRPIENLSSQDTYTIKEVIKVETQTLDLFSRNQGIEQIDFVKLDTQGSELKVLNGAKNLLARQAIKLIYVEVEFHEIYSGQCLYHDVASYLAKFNFQLYSLYNISINKKGELICADALFYIKPTK